MNYRAKFAAEVRAEMGRQQISLPALATSTGIPLSTLRRRVAGDRPFSLDEVEILARVFGTTTPELLGRAERDATTAERVSA